LLSGCTPAGEINTSESNITSPTVPAASITTHHSTPSPTLKATLTALPTPTLTPCPTATWTIIGPGMVRAPILLYHHVQPDPTSTAYAIDVQLFKDQMDFLYQHGYHTITLAQLREAIMHGNRLPSNPIIITFDEGNLDNYEYAFPCMQRYGFTGTEYIVANRLESDGFLSISQLQEMAAAGWEIGSHSMTHANLTQVSPSQLRIELLNSRLRLEKELGIEIRTFAYPYGSYIPELARKAENYGYFTAVGLGKGASHGSNMIYYLERLEIPGTIAINDFETLLDGNSTP
jgi:peptidoglycan/xylan/chitin deacetylase (PgdA/CDA1 family)